MPFPSDFQKACATAGKPIKDINLDDVNLVIRHPFNVTLETPSTIGDEFFADYISAVCLNVRAQIALVGNS
jgi:hypothetical protein